MPASSRNFDLHGIDRLNLKGLSNADFLALCAQILPEAAADRKEMQLHYYRPASEFALKVHQSKAKRILVGGGNRSGKTQTGVAEMVARATGIIPHSLRNKGIDWAQRFRGPINCRMVVSDVVNVLHEVILPMFRYTDWRGVDRQGGERGHWGWVPKMCLVNNSWEKSYSEKYRTLRVLCRNPDNIDEVLGESTIQFMSHQMKADSFASADIHFCLLDEPPPLYVYRENQARVMGVGGTMWIVMTWPKDPVINVDWMFDELYERALPGPHKDPDIDYFELPTVANVNLDTAAVEEEMGRMDEQTRSVMMLGKPIRFGNRVHHLFTDKDDVYCFRCGRKSWTVGGQCQNHSLETGQPCLSRDTVEFNHVFDGPHERGFPVVHVIDPHPRKPHMSAYFQVQPDDSVKVLATLECTDTPVVMKELADKLERELKLNVKVRLIDPNMGRSPSGVDRTRCWIDEFCSAGLLVEEADDSDVGRGIFDALLAPDRDKRRPNFAVHRRCEPFILQLNRFVWDDWKLGTDKGQKQKPKDKYDDYPALARYFCNGNFTFRGLTHGYQTVGASNYREYDNTTLWSPDRRTTYGGHY